MFLAANAFAPADGVGASPNRWTADDGSGSFASILRCPRSVRSYFNSVGKTDVAERVLLARSRHVLALSAEPQILQSYITALQTTTRKITRPPTAAACRATVAR
jgi:hypothetical protein